MERFGHADPKQQEGQEADGGEADERGAEAESMRERAAVGVAERGAQADAHCEASLREVEVAFAAHAVGYEKDGDDAEDGVGYAIQELDGDEGAGHMG